MRDIALMLVFLGLMPMVFRHTWAGVLMWTWFSIMNPHRQTYGFAYDFPFAAVIGAVTLASLFWNRERLRVPRDALTVITVLFMAWMCVTTLNAFNQADAYKGLDRALKILLMTLVAMSALRERRHIELFIWVNVLSLGYYGAKGGAFTIASGGSFRVWGPPGSFIEGNNEVGLALIVMIPLANYLRLVSRRAWVRHGLVLMMILSAAAALGTQSRGAFLALGAMGLVMWARSSRKLVSLVTMAVLGVALVSFMPASWEERMRTIETYEEDGSATGRINAWITAFRIANDRVTGGGFYTDTKEVFQKYAPNPDKVITAHSIYFQALGEHGWIGLGLFLALGGLTVWNAARVRRQALQRPETLWLHAFCGMAQVSCVGFAVGGVFLSLSYFDLPYNVMVMVVTSKHWLLERAWERGPTAATGAFGAGAPLGVALAGPQGAAAPVPGRGAA